MMSFCPTCANWLREKPDGRLFCPTCPYVCDKPEGLVKSATLKSGRGKLVSIAQCQRKNCNSKSAYSKLYGIEDQGTNREKPIYEYECRKCKKTWNSGGGRWRSESVGETSGSGNKN